MQETAKGASISTQTLCCQTSWSYPDWANRATRWIYYFMQITCKILNSKLAGKLHLVGLSSTLRVSVAYALAAALSTGCWMCSPFCTHGWVFVFVFVSASPSLSFFLFFLKERNKKSITHKQINTGGAGAAVMQHCSILSLLFVNTRSSLLLSSSASHFALTSCHPSHALQRRLLFPSTRKPGFRHFPFPFINLCSAFPLTLYFPPSRIFPLMQVESAAIHLFVKDINTASL